MAITKFNVVEGLSVGDIVRYDVIDNAANVSANNLTVTANSNLGSVSNVKISGGVSGYILRTDGTGNLSWINPGTAGLAGSNTQIQFNNNGVFGASTNLTFNIGSNVLTTTNIDVVGNLTSGNANLGNLTISSSANFNLASDVNLGNISNLHISGGNAGYVIKTDGTGNLYWGIDTTAAGGSNTQVQFNDGGTLSGNSNFTFDKNTALLNVVGNINSLNANLGNLVSANFFEGNGSLLSSITGANVTGQVGNALIAGTVYTNAQPNITSLGNLSTLNVVANITSGNANLGNIASAAFFSGNGSLLSSITGANVTGQVANALVAGTVYTGAQPNITSLGTLTELTVTANTTTGNLKTDNILYANGTPYNFTTNAAGGNTQVQFNDGNSFAGASSFTFDKVTNTLNVTNFTVSNVTANARVELGNVSNVKISGGTPGYILSTDGLGNLSWEAAGGAGFVGIVKDNFVGDGSNTAFNLSTTATGEEAIIVNIDGLVQQDFVYTVAGSVLTFSSPPTFGANIEVTIFGALSLSQSNTQILYLSGNNLAGSNNFVFDDTTNTLSVNNISSVSNVSAGNVKTDNLLYANGTPYNFTTNAAGGNTQVQFNDGNSFAGSANFTFDKATNTLSVTNIIGNGAGITYITGSNVNGQVSNALVAGTVYTNNQPNITSLGNLSSLNVVGNASLGNLIVTGNVLGSLIPDANVIYDLGSNTHRWNDLYLSGNTIYLGETVLTSDSSGITAAGNINASNANLGNLVSANYFAGNGYLLSNLNGSNVSGQVSNSLIAGTVYSANQPNITSLGSLSDLSVSGNTTIAGNLTVSGTTVYANVTTLNVKDPVIELGGTGNNDPLTNNDGKDRGTLLHYYTTSPVDAFMGWDNSNGEFGFGSNVSITNEVVTWNTYGNIRAGYIYGNGAFLTGLPEQYSNANVANYLPTYTGNLTAGNITGTNLISANYFQGDGSLLTNLNIANASVANANYAAFAGNVTIAAQPNITSLGTLSSLTVSGLITATGTGIKTANIYDSSTTLTIETRYNNISGDAGIYGNLTVGTSGTGNVTAYNANLGNLVTASYFSGNGSLLSSLTGANVTGQVSNSLISGTVYTNAQPNITSLGNLSSLVVAGNASFTGSNVFISNVANLKIPGGLNGYVLKTDGTGNLSWGLDTTDYSNANVANYLPTYTGLISGTLTTAAQPNITSLGTLTSLSVTGNTTSGNLLTSGNVIASTLISNVSTGTAPFTVSSTTRVSNLNVSYSNVSDYSNVMQQSSGNVYPVFIDNFANGNYALGVNSSISLNVSNGVLTAGGFQSGSGSGGNVTGANYVIANYFQGDGSLLTNLSIANASVANANYAAFAGNVTLAAQPNITSLGTLTTLSVTANITAGNANLGNLATANFFTGNGSLLSSITGANITGQVGNALIAGTVYTNAQPNITSLGTLTYLTVTANITSGNANLGNLTIANFFSGNGALLSSLTGSNITGQVSNALVAGTVYTNAQPNITSLGNLSTLTVVGNATAGNLKAVNGVVTLDTGIITVSSGNAGIFTVGIGNINIGLAGNVTLGSPTGNVIVQGNLSVANDTTITNLKINDLYSNRTPISVSTGTVIDSFSITKYRSAKYTMRVNSDAGYQAVEALLIHDGINSYVTIYGSLSTIGTDIITLATDINLGNVRMLASTTSANTTVNLLGTYVAD